MVSDCCDHVTAMNVMVKSWVRVRATDLMLEKIKDFSRPYQEI